MLLLLIYILLILLWKIPLVSLLLEIELINHHQEINNDHYTYASLIEIAHSITSHAKQSSSSTSTSLSFICETWIFPSLSQNDQENIANYFSMTNSSSSSSLNLMIPIILVSSSNNTDKSSNGSSSIIVPKNYFPKFSYRNYEFEEEDLLNPIVLGTRQHVPNCASIFIDLRHTMEISSVEDAINHGLFKTKMSRPHKDYFIFVMDSTFPQQEEILNSEFISELRYKYFMLLIPEKIPKEIKLTNSNLMRQKFPENIFTQTSNNGSNTSTLTTMYLVNTCERFPQTLPLFSHVCNSLISSRHFRVACTNIPSFVRPDTPDKRGSGMLYSMFAEASARYNYSFNIYLAGFNGATGFKKVLEEGKEPVWVGGLGELYSGQADLCLGAGTTPDRHRIVDPTVLHHWFTRVFYVKPPGLVSSWFSMLWPLDMIVWSILVGFVFGILIPIFYGFAYLHFAKSTPHHPIYLFFEVVDAIFRIFLEQAATVRHWTSSSLRLLIIIWTASCLVLETAYRCKLMTFLSFAAYEAYPKTHQELASSAYQLNFRYYGGLAYKDYKASTDPMHGVILGRAILVNNTVECLAGVLLNSEPTACLDYVLNGDFTITRNFTLTGSNTEGNGGGGGRNLNNKLFIRSIDTDLFYVTSWSLRKGSRWTESFNGIMLRYYAGGLFDNWVKDDWKQTRDHGVEWWKNVKRVQIEGRNNKNSTNFNQNNNNNNNVLLSKMEQLLVDLQSKGPKSLALAKITGGLVVCGIGLMLSLISFSVECIVVFVRSRRQLKNQNKKKKKGNGASRPSMTNISIQVSYSN